MNPFRWLYHDRAPLAVGVTGLLSVAVVYEFDIEDHPTAYATIVTLSVLFLLSLFGSWVAATVHRDTRRAIRLEAVLRDIEQARAARLRPTVVLNDAPFVITPEVVHGQVVELQRTIDERLSR